MPKARVQKRLYYKIGEACKEIGIQPYVLRYWETEFAALAPNKSRSGQRVYSERELEIIRRIKELLYAEGYTIAGAKKKLEAELASGTLGSEADDATPGSEEPAVEPEPSAPPAPPRSTRAAKATPLPELDTNTAEQLQSLRAGVQKALREAQDILAFLNSRSS
jgi:DNA-binding transcriptional MerR regulator